MARAVACAARAGAAGAPATAVPPQRARYCGGGRSAPRSRRAEARSARRRAACTAGDGAPAQAPAAAETGSRTRGDGGRPDGPFRVALICGGPSEERGISLNSARSALDHLESDAIVVDTYYIDAAMRAWALSRAQMYSNTPEDFDYILSGNGAAGEGAAEGSPGSMFESLDAMGAHIAATADIAFPVMHGKFGEDGGVQELLERAGAPFVGTGASAARVAFDKFEAARVLRSAGFAALPSALLEGPTEQDDEAAARTFFAAQGLDDASGRVVVKPCRAGSSVGVRVCRGVREAAAHATGLRDSGVDDRSVLEMFADGGREFTVIALGGCGPSGGDAVALLPTEVEILRDGCLDEGAESPDGSDEMIFNYRRKYLPTSQVRYHTPPRFADRTTAIVRAGAADLFRTLGLRDMARVDGWVLPPSFSAACVPPEGVGGEGDGAPVVVFSDVNLVSGMEQTSFLFQQAAEAGMSHGDVLRAALRSACARAELALPVAPALDAPPQADAEQQTAASCANGSARKQLVYVLFGGGTSERQVSLMSGTNAWLKLSSFDDVDARPFMLDAHDIACGQGGEIDALRRRSVLRLPYGTVLRHTVEEVAAAADAVMEPERAATIRAARAAASAELALPPESLSVDANASPERTTLGALLEEAAAMRAVVFIAVHGGPGEDGRLQRACEAMGVAHTGPGPEASMLCMDKVATGECITRAALAGRVSTALKATRAHADLAGLSVEGAEGWWSGLRAELWPSAGADQATALCIKPSGDGCSTGVARLTGARDLHAFARLAGAGAPRIPENALPGLAPHAAIELPPEPPAAWLFEPFVETDSITMVRDPASGDTTIEWEGHSRWVEVTVGVWGQAGSMRALSPSVTVREMGAVLSLEEKFQGGTGINLTPPPASIASSHIIEIAKKNIELAASTLGIEGFSRLDAFLHVDTGEVMIIEANTVPGMTPSTVLFHQALAEDPPVDPRFFFRRVVELAVERHERSA